MNHESYAESMLKGRMAESLIEELLRKSGNKIYRFGYEAILQNLTQIEHSFDRNGDAGQRLQAIPDFVVIDKNNVPTFVEVKYRGSGQLHESDHARLQRIRDYWEAKIVVVNSAQKPYFAVSNPPYYNGSNAFISHPLSEETSWTIDSVAYADAEILVEKYLKPKLLSTAP